MTKPYFQKDDITIYHGDCLEIMPHLEPVDLVLTDPPYGLNKKMQGGTWGKKYKESGMKKWDYIQQEAIEMLLKIGRHQIIWGGNNYILPPSRCWLAWIKPLLPTLSDIELAWTDFDKPSKIIWRGPRIENRYHETEKPLPLMGKSINFANGSATILDPFMGSGTTLVAAKQLNRKAIGIEIEEKYCEIAVKRIEQVIRHDRMSLHLDREVKEKRRGLKL